MSCHILEFENRYANTICTEHGRHIANCAMIFQEEAKQLAQKLESAQRDLADSDKYVRAMKEGVGERIRLLELQIDVLRKTLEKVRSAVGHSSIAHSMENVGGQLRMAHDSTCWRCEIDKALEPVVEKRKSDGVYEECCDACRGCSCRCHWPKPEVATEKNTCPGRFTTAMNEVVKCERTPGHDIGHVGYVGGFRYEWA